MLVRFVNLLATLFAFCDFAGAGIAGAAEIREMTCAEKSRPDTCVARHFGELDHPGNDEIQVVVLTYSYCSYCKRMESAIRAAGSDTPLARAMWTRITLDSKDGMEQAVREHYAGAGEKPFSAVPASYAYHAGKIIGTATGFESVDRLTEWMERVLRIAAKRKGK